MITTKIWSGDCNYSAVLFVFLLVIFTEKIVLRSIAVTDLIQQLTCITVS